MQGESDPFVMAAEQERRRIVAALRGHAERLDGIVAALPWPVRRDPHDDGADRADARALRYIADLIESGAE